MRRSWIAILMALTGAACGPVDKHVTLSGTVEYAEYRSGDIKLELVEDETRSCSPFSSCVSRIPGEVVRRATLTRPAEFSISADVQGFTMHLLAFAVGETDNRWECEAGAMVSLDVKDTRDLVLTLVAGQCPALE
jgi:hypothetical protein